MRVNNRRIKRRNATRKKILISSIISLSILTCAVIIYQKVQQQSEISKIREDNLIELEATIEEEKNIKSTEIIISLAGDCTLGTDTNFAFEGSLPSEIENYGNDYSKLMRNVSPIFSEDDYTIINLETTFTQAIGKRNKGEGVAYHFKGPKDYTNILKSSSIEGVTLSNNHIYDYGSQGFNDTVEALQESNLDYCGEGYKIIKEVKGIKIGVLGYNGWDSSNEQKDKIKSDINYLKEEGVNIVIPYFHWGEENSYNPNEIQKELARFSIDNGADMVVGSHPHVMQTMENYKGKLIAYSFGNFCFGGNSNPRDKRTFILQGKFNLEDGDIKKIEYKIIPILISSVESRNDYVPTPATGGTKEEIFNKLNELSPTISIKIKDEFFSI
ncbi:CapA family protein [Clostridium vincentii]|uniref:Capsule biosynthesis protein CapA n=1 Tax=Clostridium vincentii TaxID=52704 RepID=A0A2T0BH01_9CLOT|nr:CapA family protein [Clostridium vincentii]PRR83154.1 Capsule biosynthesis protein CapA [Clostridium vincentii]